MVSQINASVLYLVSQMKTVNITDEDHITDLRIRKELKCIKYALK